MSMNKFEKIGAVLSSSTAATAQSQSTTQDSTGGSASGTFSLVACDSSKVNNNFATVAARLAQIKTDVASLYTGQTSIRTVLEDIVTKLNKANS